MHHRLFSLLLLTPALLTACASAGDRLNEGMQLQSEGRYKGAGVVFEVGHPAADAGDEVAAGPLMELVVEFWPNHYMAPYHARAARFEAGDAPWARDCLECFLQEYKIEDGWRSKAPAMLSEIGDK